MAERHFEIIVSSRQLAVGLGLVVVLVAVGFGLGIAAGFRVSPTAEGRGSLAEAPLPPPEPPVVEQVAVFGTPPPQATPMVLDRGAEPRVAPVGPVPSPVPPATPMPTAVATPVPTRPPSPTAVPTRPPARVTPIPGIWVQVAALSQRDSAEGVRQRLLAMGYTAEQVSIQPMGPLFRVRLGPFPDEVSAGRVSARLEGEGFERPYVVRE